MNYYNEWDKPTAAWLRELIAQGLIPQGEVDERSITEVQPADLRGYTQCHFFAGIGGWPYALQLAGWSADRPVWTGSCPCQPYSVAGKREGHKDERHLWPEMFRLIRERRPKHVFGEQVTGAIGHGWIDGVSTDLEGEGYGVGAVVLGAHSVGAPHIRQRLYWVGHRIQQGLEGRRQSGEVAIPQGWQGKERYDTPTGRAGGLPDRDSGRCEQRDTQERSVSELDANGSTGGLSDAASEQARDARQPRECSDASCGLLNPDCAGPQQGQPTAEAARYGGAVESAGGTGWMGDSSIEPSERRTRSVFGTKAPIKKAWELDGSVINRFADAGKTGFWSDYDTIPFLDGKARRVEPGTFPLAHGVPARVVRLRGYGNAIIPQCAAEFVMAYMELAS